MTSADFIQRVRIAVYESAIAGTLSLLHNPPGRRPSDALVELSQWFNQHSPDDKERIRGIIQLAVRDAVFEILTVLDGMSAIRKADEEIGFLELRYTTKGQSFLLNDPGGDPLHDLFAEQVPPT